MGLSAGWIQSRTGVRERRVAAADETLADLAAAAADRALAAAAVSPREVDLVLVATLTADQRMPNAAPVVAEMIGARGAGAIDVGAACTGFVSALSTGLRPRSSRDARTRSWWSEPRCSAGSSTTTTGAPARCSATAPAPSWSRPAEGDDAIGPSCSVPTAPADLIEPIARRDLVRMQGPRHLPPCGRADQRSSLGRRAGCGGAERLAEIDALRLPPGQRPHPHRDRRPAWCCRRSGSSTASAATATSRRRRSRWRSTRRAGGDAARGSRVLLAAFGAGLTWGATVVEWGSEADAA